MKMIKKNLLKPYLMILITSIFLNCSDDDVADNVFKQYTGNYKIVSYRANLPVDLNNDGVTSVELTNEITSFSFGELKVSPTEMQRNSAKLVSFLFPKTWITFQYPDSPEGSVQFLRYGFATFYEFTNNSFYLKDTSYVEDLNIDNVESDKLVILNGQIDVVDSNHLKMSISKEYYDFNTSGWIRLAIDVIFEKNKY